MGLLRPSGLSADSLQSSCDAISNDVPIAICVKAVHLCLCQFIEPPRLFPVTQIFVRFAHIQIQRRVKSLNTGIVHRIRAIQRFPIPPKRFERCLLVPCNIVRGYALFKIVHASVPRCHKEFGSVLEVPPHLPFHAFCAQTYDWIVRVHSSILLRTA